MSEKKVINFREESFHCPFCDVFASQEWSNDEIFLKGLFNFQEQCFLDYRSKMNSRKVQPSAYADDLRRKLNLSVVESRSFLDNIKKTFLSYSNRNYFFSSCKNCSKFSIWIDEKMVYPIVSTAPIAKDDMPDDVKEIYEEARLIQKFSPRATAALLRVALEKLTIHLGEKEGNLNNRIKNLKQKGLPEKVIQSLDIVRITANEGGAHAGEIDLTGKDNQEIVNTLFFLINFIVEKTITEPKYIENAFNKLPEGKKQGTKNRDKN